MAYYQLYELNRAALGPIRAASDATRLYFQSPLNPLSQTVFGRSMVASCELFERSTRHYGKPEFGLTSTVVDGQLVGVQEEVVWQKAFCKLIRFSRQLPEPRNDQKLLIVAPLSGHYATLLRGTVEAMLPHHDVYITDWVDARMVPLSDGSFDLDSYIDYLIDMFRILGPDTHVMAVCQPSVPVLAAVTVMEMADDPASPQSMILMGGPIDTRINPTAVNTMAEGKSIEWFEQNVIMQVPFPNPGFLRQVYPGFLQLTGFMSMNLDSHMRAHRELFVHLIEGDGDSAEKHTAFYDEYLAVMDLSAEFYLQTVQEVFINHSLPKGELYHRDQRIDLTQIRRTALFTIEGERDDISGVGQTKAAQTLCSNIPQGRRNHLLQKKVGHYGVFNGSRFRRHIRPEISQFIADMSRRP